MSSWSDPPTRLRRMMEPSWPFEVAGSMLTLPPGLVPAGDGHPVLVLPGFLASDRSTFVLRETVRAHGYRVSGWRLGRNLGPSGATLDRILAGLEQLQRVDGRRVSIIGWSLGGIYARWLARARPELVRQVITLASPFRMEDSDPRGVREVWEEVERVADGDVDLISVPESVQAPLRVPAVSIYTRTDGVVRWRLCLDDTGRAAPNPRAENVEVYGTHIGLGINPAALFAVLDRLALPEDAWHPFAPPAMLRLLYPTPPSPPGRTEAAA
jgi:pimeloyl-ACP methyl ester carboxylesterase